MLRLLLLLVIVLCFSTPVRLQDVIESSGEAAIPPEESLTETFSSGEAPTSLTPDDVTGNVTELNPNSTLLNLIELNGEPETTIGEMNSTPTSPPTTTIVTTEVVTTTLPSTTTVGTTSQETTTTPATTTSSPTTTTVVTTTKKTTTAKPVTTTRKPHPKTTVVTVPTPSSTSRDSSDVEAKQCSFVDEGFSCDLEVICFGEGVIDCNDFDEIPEASSEMESTSGVSDYDEEEEEEEEEVATFPPELVGKISQDKSKFPFLWKMKSLGTTDLPTSTEAVTTSTVTTAVTQQPSTVVTDVSTTFSANGSTTVEVTTAPTTTVAETTTEEQTTSNRSADFVSILSLKEENETLLTTTANNGTDDADDNSTTTVLSSSTTFVDFSTTTSTEVEETTTIASTTTTTTVAPTTTTKPTTTRRPRNSRRYKRNGLLSSGSESADSPSSSLSASLHIAALEAPRQKVKVRSCRIVGNLKCSPVPSVAFCRGKSVCQVVPSSGEKSEKSTSAKGVENWAIAVIAICAIAAAFTISLLVYLVVTSWKKLKVQPQNGVTTLTYVNNTPP